MKLNNKNIEIKQNAYSEVESIKYKNIEVLYQADEVWKKQFPIIFPSLGISKGFEYKGEKFKMPKHGFWKELNWESFYENEEIISVATILDKDKFPFMMDITQRIGLDEDTIYINYELTNLEKEEAYFQFGIHPAFKINDSSFIENIPPTNIINLNGELEDKKIIIDGLPIKSLGFGNDYDTLIAKNISKKEINIVNENIILNFKFDSPHVQIWKPKDSNFVCFEPWYGSNDAWYEAPSDITKKEEIIKLGGGMIWSATLEISLRENKKAK